MDRDKVIELAQKVWRAEHSPVTVPTISHIVEFAALIEAEVRGEPMEFEFSDKGKAEIVICPKGLTYGVRCVDFPEVVFAQFTFESDAKQFVNIFNGMVAPRVESPVTGGGGGFESHPVPTNTPAVDAGPDWRHPKIQALIAADARKSIVIWLIERLIENPEYETTASDMEYWSSIHDALLDKLTHPTPAVVQQLVEAAADAKSDIHSARLCEVNSMSSRDEMRRLMDSACEKLCAAIAAAKVAGL